MNYTITIPIYKELPHIEENLDSIGDYPHMLIVDNSANGWCRRFEKKGAHVVYRPENIGVARSWNLGIREGRDYTFLVSSSVRFNSRFYFVFHMLKTMVQEQVPGIEYGMFTQLGWHCNAISHLTVEKCGLFDENFYPAYEEDVDYCRRLYLAGLHTNKRGGTIGGTIPITSIDAKPVEIAATIKQAGLQVNFNRLRDYYIEKWGGDHDNEKFDTPFNSGSLKYFPTHSIEELRAKYEL